MPITISVPPGSAGEVRFAMSPLLEFGAAWHVLACAEHHPERAGWVAKVRNALPEDLIADLVAWSFAVSAVRSTLLVDPSLIPAADWDGQLAWVGRMPAAEFAAAMLRPLLRVRGRSANLADPRVRARVVTLARARGPAAERVARVLADDPRTAQRSLVSLLDRCWSLFFRAGWAQAAPVLAGEVRTRTALCAARGWPAALRGVSPALDVGPDGRLVIDKVQSKRMMADGRGLMVVPTTFGGGHLYVADEPARPVVIHYPLPVPLAAAGQRLTLRRLAVLADPARLEVCRAIAIEPRSAREIARLWRFSESAVTKHLSVLRAAGLVKTERAGHFVRYSLDASAVAAVGGDLLQVLCR
jgi:DNA-binding transcriptional ArsR family regulator